MVNQNDSTVSIWLLQIFMYQRHVFSMNSKTQSIQNIQFIKKRIHERTLDQYKLWNYADG